MYTQVLNRLSDEEWKDLDLPHPSSISPRQNVQLPDIAAHASDHVMVGVDGEVASGDGCDAVMSVDLKCGESGPKSPPVLCGGVKGKSRAYQDMAVTAKVHLSPTTLCLGPDIRVRKPCPPLQVWLS